MIKFSTSYNLLFLSIISTFLFACGGADSTSTEKNNVELVSGSFVDQEVMLDEGSINTTSLTFLFTASDTGTINYSSYDIDAVAKSDYQGISGSIDAEKGESYSLTIPIFADTRIEDNEKVGLLLTDSTNNKLADFIGILVNDDFPIVSVTSVPITEGDVGNQVLKFTVSLSEETVAPFSVSIVTLAEEGVGYADPANDYTALNFDIVFYAGETSKVVEVEVFGDTEIEPDEVVNLTASYGTTTTEPVAGIIRTDDVPGSGAPTFEVNSGRSLQVAENTTDIIYQMPFSIDDDGGFTESFILDYYLIEYRDSESSNSTELAKINSDFETSLGQVTILPGQVDYVAEFSILDDLSLENVEVLEFVIANSSGVEFGSARIYISDNETPVFNIYRKYTDESGSEVISSDLTYAESSNLLGEHNIYIEMPEPVGYDYEIEYILRLPNNGEVSSAVNSTDFVSAITSTEIESKVLTVLNGDVSPAGDVAYAIDFKINDDQTIEGHESFFIELRNSNGTLIGDAVEVKIINDDMPRIAWQAENAESFIDGDVRFLESIPLDDEGDLKLSILLDNGNGEGAAALEDYALTITRSVVSNGSCSWKNNSDLSNDELLIANAGSQTFSKLATSFSLSATSVDDNLVECDEYVQVSASLNSLIEGIISSTSSSINLISVNDDEAFLDVYGFDVSETEGETNFELKINADISLAVNVLVSSTDAEVDDASFTSNNVGVELNASNHTVINFQEGVDDSSQEIIVNLTNDTIVELTENYQLTVALAQSTGIPIGLRSCEIGLVPECTEILESLTTVSVNGVVRSEDELTLTITEKATDSVLESVLTPLNLIDRGVQYPYQVILSNEVASDIPTIELA